MLIYFYVIIYYADSLLCYTFIMTLHSYDIIIKLNYFYYIILNVTIWPGRYQLFIYASHWCPIDENQAGNYVTNNDLGLVVINRKPM